MPFKFYLKLLGICDLFWFSSFVLLTLGFARNFWCNFGCA